jgi:hypothetical protein
MTISLYVVTAILAGLLTFSAALKLSGKPAVIESYARVGVDRRRLPLLAAVLLAGAGGLVVGLWWTPLGITAAGALVVYFALALVAHALHDDMSHAATPALLLVLAAVDAVLFALRQ